MQTQISDDGNTEPRSPPLPVKLVSIPANPVPEGIVTGTLKTPDGVSLRFARWLPPAGRRGTVCILPGRSEWIEKYFETVRDLRARGFAVAILDWRGQGLSDRALPDRRRGHVRNFSEYDLDLETLMREVVLPDCPPPLFAIGHSMGATVLLRAAFQGHRWFDRIVLSAPMIAVAGMNSIATAGTMLPTRKGSSSRERSGLRNSAASSGSVCPARTRSSARTGPTPASLPSSSTSPAGTGV